VSTTFDLLLRGARVIDPASGIDGIKDVAIRNARLRGSGRHFAGQRSEVVDVTGQIRAARTDRHPRHVYPYVTGRFGVNADMVGVQSAVTTLVDQGGPSCMTLPGFRISLPRRRSPDLRILSAYLVGGLEGHYYPLYWPDGVDIDATVKAATAIAIWFAASRPMPRSALCALGIRVIEMAAEIGVARTFGLCALRAAMGSAETGTNGEDVDTILTRVIPLLRAGDVLAHPFTRHPAVSQSEGEVIRSSRRP